MSEQPDAISNPRSLSDVLWGTKKAFTTFYPEPDSGIVVVDPNIPSTRVTALRRWNFIEALVAFTAVLAVVWCELVLSKDATATFRYAFGIPVMVWMFILSPMVHYRFEKEVFLTEAQRRHGLGWYFWELRGLGNPLRYYFSLDGQPPLIRKHWRAVLVATLAWTALFVCAAITFHEEMNEKWVHIHGESLLATIAFRGALILLIDAILLFVALPVMLRLDNAARSLRVLLAFMSSLFLMVLLFNLFFQVAVEPFREGLSQYNYIDLRGATASERFFALFHPIDFGGQWSGYVLWGWIQQFIFLSYFGVLFGKAFDVVHSKSARCKACFCTALFFGLIHLPNAWLMFFTFTGGFWGAFLFYQCRNLFVVGFVHGGAGSLLNRMTPINFSVGPGQIGR